MLQGSQESSDSPSAKKQKLETEQEQSSHAITEQQELLSPAITLLCRGCYLNSNSTF